VAAVVGAAFYVYLIPRPGLGPRRQLATMSVDFDGDGIANGEEISYGLNPMRADSDGDGVPDNIEPYWNLDIDGDGLINALDPDSDDDGLPDGIEDVNKNGKVDAGETDPCNPDTDGDGLNDKEELDYGTDLLNVDSDNDGIADGNEPSWNFDTDNDGLINALDRDSDGDEIEDGREISLGIDPLDQDTDDDQVMDGEETRIGTNPLNRDTDNDGLTDGQEAAGDAYWAEAENLVSSDQIVNDADAVGGKAAASKADGSIFEIKPFGLLRSGVYKYYVRAKCISSGSGNPRIWLKVGNGVNLSDVHALSFLTQESISHPELPPQLPGEYRPLIFSFPPEALPSTPTNVYRWYSTPDFELHADAELSLGVSASTDDTIFIDRILLLRTDNVYRSATDPLVQDTDNDGISDGNESSSNSYWYEAEHFALENEQIKLNANASDGKEVIREAAGSRLCLISNETYYPKGRYQIYVRGGKGLQAAPDLKLALSIQCAGRTLTASINLTNLYEWNLGIFTDGKASFELAEPSKITITISQTKTGPNDIVFVDKILLKRLALNELEFVPVESVEVFWSQFRLEEEIVLYKSSQTFHIYSADNGFMWFKERQPALENVDAITYIGEYQEPARVVFLNVPRDLTDPMDLDTDHDGYRAADGALPSSKGHLTDGKELEIGTNPFDLDTDNDGIPDNIDFNPLTDDTDGDGLLDGIEDTVEPYGIFDTPDDADYLDFLDDDTDDDGTLDGNEDKNYNSFKDPGETDPRNKDSDNDGINDGIELGLAQPEGKNTANWVGDADPSTTTDPLDPDSDDDALFDGQEDANKNGKVDTDETDPQNPDTDSDGLRDGEDPNPLTPDYPDLSISPDDIEFSPAKPVNTEWASVSATIRNLGTIGVQNKRIYIGFYDGDPDNLGSAIGWGSILSIGVGETKSVEPEIYGEAAEWWRIAGTHNIYVKILTQVGDSHPKGYAAGARIFETTYANNKAGKDIKVEGPPTADAGPDQGVDNVIIWEGDTVYLEGKGSDPDGYIALYEWDFDSDGAYDWNSTTSGSATHVYENAGVWTATLRVTDDTGYIATDETLIVVASKGRDADGDGLADLYETSIGSDPNNWDSDNDGLYDDEEFSVAEQFGASALNDLDNDGLINIIDSDSDGDGIKDGEEVYLTATARGYAWYDTNPYYWDTDYDGLSDYEEREELSTSALNPDTDSDGLNDYDEIKIYGTDPNDRDSDGDGISDGFDASPLVEPSDIEWSDQFPPGMIRFIQNYKVYGIDGRSEVWKWVWDTWPAGHAEFDYSTGDKGTRASKITSSKVKAMINKYWEDSDFTAVSATHTYGWVQSNAYWKMYGPDGWHPKGYKIIYDRLIDDYDVSFKNKRTVSSPDPSGNRYWYSVQKISVMPNKRQSIVIQYRMPYLDRYSFVDDSNYTLPAFSYSLYISNDFNDDTNLPIFQNLAIAMELERHSYEVEMRIPAEYAIQSTLYIHIMPVWLTKSGGAVTKTAIQPSTMKICAIIKRIQLSPDKEMTLGFGSGEDLDDPVPAESYFDSPTVTKILKTFTIEKVKQEGEVGAYIVTAGETTDKIVKVGNLAFTLRVVKSTTAQVSSIDDLMELEEEVGELAKARYSKATKALKAASVGSVLVTDGVQAALAFKEGDEIKGTLYATKTTLGVLKEVSTIEKLSAKSGTLKALGSAKGQAALTIAIGTVQVGINLYESTQTSDEIVKLRCYEGASAAAIDTGISLIPYYGQVIEGSWTLAIIIYSPFITKEWVKEVCSSPGTAITFLFEYFATTEIPSQIAEDAYKWVAEDMCKLVRELNELGIPAIFIQPE
jgi:hypothetical protein